MKEYITSNITGKIYYPSDCVRIVNNTQAAAYMMYGVKPVDVYGSSDYKTGKPMLITVFDRAESFEAYKKWCRYELIGELVAQNEEENTEVK